MDGTCEVCGAAAGQRLIDTMVSLSPPDEDGNQWESREKYGDTVARCEEHHREAMGLSRAGWLVFDSVVSEINDLPMPPRLRVLVLDVVRRQFANLEAVAQGDLEAFKTVCRNDLGVDKANELIRMMESE